MHEGDKRISPALQHLQIHLGCHHHRKAKARIPGTRLVALTRHHDGVDLVWHPNARRLKEVSSRLRLFMESLAFVEHDFRIILQIAGLHKLCGTDFGGTNSGRIYVLSYHPSLTAMSRPVPRLFVIRHGQRIQYFI